MASSITAPEAPARLLYVYDLPTDLLQSISRKRIDEDLGAELPLFLPTDRDKPSAIVDETSVSAQACALCAVPFTTVVDQRSHARSDLHHYNLKLRLRGGTPVSQAEFDTLLEDLDESLSGSDASDDDNDDSQARDQHTSSLATLLRKNVHVTPGGDVPNIQQLSVSRTRGMSPIIWLSLPTLLPNTYYGLYRAILTSEEQNDEWDIASVLKNKQLPPSVTPIPQGPRMFLCMIGGGHFAAMVVALAPRPPPRGHSKGPLDREASVLVHKTFHRYTTRRKQGGAQSANDNSKGTAHSAGSQIRRHNEQALVEDVRQVLHDWKALLDTAQLLFVRATGTFNRRTLFGPYEGQILRLDDRRLRSFPFSTRRATQKELMRSFIELTRLRPHEVDPEPPPPLQTQQPTRLGVTSKSGNGSHDDSHQPSEEEEMAQLHTSQIQALVRRSKLAALLAYLDRSKLSADFRFWPESQHHHAPTPLHLAASMNSPTIVLGLLLRAGADPSARGPTGGRVAFELAGDRATRDAFRVARFELGENAARWDEAGVPVGISRKAVRAREEEERRDREAQESERRRAEEERLQAVESVTGSAGRGGAVQSIVSFEKTARDRREEEARGMTAETRAQLERERRARAVEDRIRRMQARPGAS